MPCASCTRYVVDSLTPRHARIRSPALARHHLPGSTRWSSGTRNATYAALNSASSSRYPPSGVLLADALSEDPPGLRHLVRSASLARSFDRASARSTASDRQSSAQCLFFSMADRLGLCKQRAIPVVTYDAVHLDSLYSRATNRPGDEPRPVWPSWVDRELTGAIAASSTLPRARVGPRTAIILADVNSMLARPADRIPRVVLDEPLVGLRGDRSRTARLLVIVSDREPIGCSPNAMLRAIVHCTRRNKRRSRESTVAGSLRAHLLRSPNRTS